MAANARLDGLEASLGMTGNDFNIALTMFFIPYCLLECPANIFLRSLRPSRWLPGITIVWGIVMVSMGLVRNYPQLLGTRVALGVAEAGLFPGISYYLTFWYPRHKLQTRISIFFAAASLAGAFSGLLAYAIGYMSGDGGRLAWSWIFILEGTATVVLGIISLFVVVDYPITAKFISPEERAFIVYQLQFEHARVGEEEHLELRHFWAVVTDWQIWVHILIFMSVATPIYAFTFFIPTIIHNFGYSVPVSQLLTIPPFVLGSIVVVATSLVSDRLRLRSPFIFAGLLLMLVGISINMANTPNGVKYFGCYWIAVGAFTSLAGMIAWLGNNLAGQYKRGMGMGIQIGIGNFCGMFAANMFPARDAPRYILGEGLTMMFVGFGIVCVPLTVIIYTMINQRRERILQGMLERGEKLSAAEIKRLGDRAPTFRYMI